MSSAAAWALGHIARSPRPTGRTRARAVDARAMRRAVAEVRHVARAESAREAAPPAVALTGSRGRMTRAMGMALRWALLDLARAAGIAAEADACAVHARAAPRAVEGGESSTDDLTVDRVGTAAGAGGLDRAVGAAESVTAGAHAVDALATAGAAARARRRVAQ